LESDAAPVKASTRVAPKRKIEALAPSIELLMAEAVTVKRDVTALLAGKSKLLPLLKIRHAVAQLLGRADAMKSEIAALIAEDCGLREEKELDEFGERLKVLQEMEDDEFVDDDRLDSIIQLLCDLHNRFNSDGRWVPGRQATIWATIEILEMPLSRGAPVLRIKRNGDAFLQMGATVLFNVFSVSMDKLVVELNLKITDRASGPVPPQPDA
jgi:hypothetical protein